MRKFVISLAAAGAALVVASPAAAQYYRQPQQPYGYNGGYGAQPYGNGYGYNGYGNNGFGQVRALQARIDALQNRLRYAGVRGNSAEGLRKEARNIEKRLRSSRYGGLNPYEINDISQRIARLEQRVNYAMAGRNSRYGYNNNNGYGGYNAYNNNGGYARERGDHDGDHQGDRDDDHQGYDRDD
jgi:hypothetical protein